MKNPVKCTKIHVASPRTPLYGEAHSATAKSIAGGGGKPILQEPGSPGSAIWAPSFGPLGLALPPTVDFVPSSDATDAAVSLADGGHVMNA